MRRKSILIIDDEEMFCRLVKQNLEETGQFSVSFASNGRDGVALAREEKPALILLDVMMPQLSGPEVAEILQNDERTQNIPVVFLTALAADKDIGETVMRIIGRHPSLAKPVALRDLIEVINTIISSREKET